MLTPCRRALLLLVIAGSLGGGVATPAAAVPAAERPSGPDSGPTAAAPARGAARALCTRARKKRPKTQRGEDADGSERAPKSSKVTAKRILKWNRSGMDDREIAAKAAAAGYRLTKAEKAKLRRGHAPKSLIAALKGSGGETAAPLVASAAPTPAPAPTRPGKASSVDLAARFDPNDIDFDSVPPPPGIPSKYVRSSKAPRRPPPPATAGGRPTPGGADEARITVTPTPKVASSGQSPARRQVFSAGQ